MSWTNLHCGEFVAGELKSTMEAPPWSLGWRFCRLCKYVQRAAIIFLIMLEKVCTNVTYRVPLMLDKLGENVGCIAKKYSKIMSHSVKCYIHKKDATFGNLAALTEFIIL
jgi:hypothetical protein